MTKGKYCLYRQAMYVDAFGKLSNRHKESICPSLKKTGNGRKQGNIWMILKN